jgi:hypothetical protein
MFARCRFPTGTKPQTFLARCPFLQRKKAQPPRNGTNNILIPMRMKTAARILLRVDALTRLEK